jgi:hypothetical protein
MVKGKSQRWRATAWSCRRSSGTSASTGAGSATLQFSWQDLVAAYAPAVKRITLRTRAALSVTELTVRVCGWISVNRPMFTAATCSTICGDASGTGQPCRLPRAGCGVMLASSYASGDLAARWPSQPACVDRTTSINSAPSD